MRTLHKRTRGTSALGVFTINGMIDAAFTSCSGVTADMFIEMLKLVVVDHIVEVKTLVVMDSASIHHDERVEALLKLYGAQVVYLPRYSLDYNPIEEAFSKVRSGSTPLLTRASAAGVRVHPQAPRLCDDLA